MVQIAIASGEERASISPETPTPASRFAKEETAVTVSTLLFILLIVLLIGALPSWPYSRGWGYFPSGTVGLILLVTLIMALLGGI